MAIGYDDDFQLLETRDHLHECDAILDSDPRIFFAAERTLMAWIRTAISLIGLGFLVARFGTFLRMVAGQTGGESHRFSLFLGVGLVLLGSLVMAVTAVQHRQFVKAIQAADLPTGYSTSFSTWIALGLSIIGVLLTAYLVLSARDLNLSSAIVR